MMNGTSTKVNKKQSKKMEFFFPVKWSRFQIWLLYLFHFVPTTTAVDYLPYPTLEILFSL